jgi:hypothetical protein
VEEIPLLGDPERYIRLTTSAFDFKALVAGRPLVEDLLMNFTVKPHHPAQLKPVPDARGYRYFPPATLPIVTRVPLPHILPGATPNAKKRSNKLSDKSGQGLNAKRKIMEPADAREAALKAMLAQSQRVAQTELIKKAQQQASPSGFSANVSPSNKKLSNTDTNANGNASNTQTANVNAGAGQTPRPPGMTQSRSQHFLQQQQQLHGNLAMGNPQIHQIQTQYPQGPNSPLMNQTQIALIQNYLVQNQAQQMQAHQHHAHLAGQHPSTFQQGQMQQHLLQLQMQQRLAAQQTPNLGQQTPNLGQQAPKPDIPDSGN